MEQICFSISQSHSQMADGDPELGSRASVSEASADAAEAMENERM